MRSQAPSLQAGSGWQAPSSAFLGKVIARAEAMVCPDPSLKPAFRSDPGAANKPFAGIESDKLALVEGAGSIMRFGDGIDHDVRCGKCGSFLYSVVRGGTYVHVTLGSMSEAPTLRPEAHIFVGSKASWEVIEDDLPQHEEF
ncbi:MAG: GFA family protein [Aquabacterium sp.]